MERVAVQAFLDEFRDHEILTKLVDALIRALKWLQNNEADTRYEFEG